LREKEEIIGTVEVCEKEYIPESEKNEQNVGFDKVDLVKITKSTPSAGG